mmetsp:Transcript_64001/g.101877  ORF Transcript_64001/g.101877 Transcript_64001/m.101877 type:complete len:265 (-) Transcript_64001:245-1039(-)
MWSVGKKPHPIGRSLFQIPALHVNPDCIDQVQHQISPVVNEVEGRRLLLTGQHLQQRTVLLRSGGSHQPGFQMTPVHEVDVPFSTSTLRHKDRSSVSPPVTMLLAEVDDAEQLLQSNCAILSTFDIRLEDKLLLELLQVLFIGGAGEGQLCKPLHLAAFLFFLLNLFLHADRPVVGEKDDGDGPPLPLSILESLPDLGGTIHDVSVDHVNPPANLDTQIFGLSLDICDDEVLELHAMAALTEVKFQLHQRPGLQSSTELLPWCD